MYRSTPTRPTVSLNRRLLPCYVLALFLAFLILDLAAHPFSSEPVTGRFISPDGLQKYLAPPIPSADISVEDIENLRLLKSFTAQFPTTIPQGDLRWVGENGNTPDTEWMQRRRAGREAFDWMTTKNVIVFGDSVCQVAGPAYLEWLKTKEGAEPGTEGKIGLKDELKWVDALYMLHSNTSEVTYNNFGSGGAVTDRSVIPPIIAGWADFPKELSNYESRLHPFRDEEAGTNLPAGWTGKDELVIIAFGNNDEKQLARAESRDDDDATIHALVSALISHASRLYDDGYRHFLFVTAPPIDINPQTTLITEGGYNDRFLTKEIHAKITTLLKAAVEVWDEKYAVKGNGMLFDMDGYLRILHAFPQLFGLTDLHRFWWIVDGQGKRPNDMGLMWNDSQGHPSANVMRQMASAVHGFLLRQSTSTQYGDARYQGVDVSHTRPIPLLPPA